MGHNKLSVGRPISYSYMRAAFTSQSVPVQAMLLWRCWPSIETTLGEYISRVSACVGFDASHSAHVPDTGVIIYKAHTHGATGS